MGISLSVNAEEAICTKADGTSYEVCGSWGENELSEVKSLYSGKEEIHKIIKQKENYYILHTCSGRNKVNTCMGGFVYVFERINGELKVKPEKWDWVF